MAHAIPTLLSREFFRQAVFERDDYQCVVCGEEAEFGKKGWVTNLDPHHLMERRLWQGSAETEGYYLDNGVTVCEAHHRMAEQTLLSPDDLRAAAGIKKVLLPEHLYADNDYTYTKWGDIVMPTGIRYRGELFMDESVQKVLAEGKVLSLYSEYVKYPRTMHLHNSEKLGPDDRRLASDEELEGEEYVMLEKRDGENTNMYPDFIHARSLNSGPGIERKAVAAIHSQIAYQIPTGWRICGENLYEQHTIVYEDLDSYFEVFSIWDERNYCLSWDETVAYCEMLGLITVPVLWRGIYDAKAIEAVRKEKLVGKEGYVLRRADEFPLSKFRTSVVKFVQGSFQIVHGRTSNRKVIPNKLKNGRKF